MINLKIEGMMCQHCVNNIKKVLETIGEDVQIDLDTGLASFNSSADDQQIIEIIEEAGYEVIEITR